MTAFAVVLAGGSGTRLWPCSRQDRPKQLLPLLGDRSLLQATVARLWPAVPPEQVIVLTARAHVHEVRRQLPDVPPAQVVGEPEALGTAAAVGLGVALVRARQADATMFVLPADHVIDPLDRFHADLVVAADTARAGYLVTFGIPPTGAETGYGYIEVGAALPDAPAARRVVCFVEKPDRPAAQRYVAAGGHLWNSGMFAWTVAGIERALARHVPALAERVREICALAAAGRLDDDSLAEVWSRIGERTTIDYAVMERSDRVACVPAGFRWSDVGSWAALPDVMPADADGNVVVGRHVGIDTTGCVVYASGGRLVATVGLSELVVVDTEDAVLVCPRERAQDVRRIVERLRRDDPGLV